MERPKSRFRQASWRLCNCLMSTFFALATYVQMNDPDAGLWMVAYAVPAGLCFLVCLKSTITETSLWRRLADLHVLVSTTFGTMLGWTLYRDNITNIFQQEEGREFGGLLLTVVWLLLCRHSGRDEIGIFRLCTGVGITAFPFVAWIYYYVNKELRASWPSHCKTAL